VRLKYLPELHFKVDPSIAEGQRVEQILRELRDGERPSLDADEEDEK